jgi:hypothetical protein
VGCIGQTEPTIEQIKADLIGHYLTDREEAVWTFAALSEIEHFDIRGKQVQENIIEYDVSIRLHDLSTDTHFLADALIVYTQIDGEWYLISTVTKLFKYLYGMD